MPSCDMCGKDNASFRALIEGVELTVCERCSKFGKVLAAPKPQERRHSFSSATKAEPMELVVDDAATRIKNKREQLKLTQQEFAKLINEKTSVVQHLEHDAHHLSLDLAKRLERILHIQLVEKAKEVVVQKSSQKTEAFTLGDFIRIKK